MNEKLIEYQNELSALEAWFKDYDSKTSQYQRHLRIYGKSDIDIADLDYQALIKADRIKELIVLIKEEFETTPSTHI